MIYRVQKYPVGWRLLHWLMALMVLTLIPVGLWMASRAEADIWGELTNTLYSWHKLIGFSVLSLMILRIIVRVRFEDPGLPGYDTAQTAVGRRTGAPPDVRVACADTPVWLGRCHGVPRPGHGGRVRAAGDALRAGRWGTGGVPVRLARCLCHHPGSADRRSFRGSGPSPDPRGWHFQADAVVASAVGCLALIVGDQASLMSCRRCMIAGKFRSSADAQQSAPRQPMSHRRTPAQG